MSKATKPKTTKPKPTKPKKGAAVVGAIENNTGTDQPTGQAWESGKAVKCAPNE